LPAIPSAKPSPFEQARNRVNEVWVDDLWIYLKKTAIQVKQVKIASQDKNAGRLDWLARIVTATSKLLDGELGGFENMRECAAFYRRWAGTVIFRTPSVVRFCNRM
jgi:hypothetical protein